MHFLIICLEFKFWRSFSLKTGFFAVAGSSKTKDSATGSRPEVEFKQKSRLDCRVRPEVYSRVYVKFDRMFSLTGSPPVTSFFGVDSLTMILMRFSDFQNS